MNSMVTANAVPASAPADSCVMVIFGASGDLAQRKLIPALYNLARVGNSLFEPIWNRSYIDHVQITAAETLGVEMRGGYYETSGALRDMVPNHLFQLVSLTTMEPPISWSAPTRRRSCAGAVLCGGVPTATIACA